MSDSRNPDARRRPGNLRFCKTPVAASLSIVRMLQDKRRAASARRIRRGSFALVASSVGTDVPLRIPARIRERSAGETVGSDFNPALITSNVVGSIILFRTRFASFAGNTMREKARQGTDTGGTDFERDCLIESESACRANGVGPSWHDQCAAPLQEARVSSRYTNGPNQCPPF